MSLGLPGVLAKTNPGVPCRLGGGRSAHLKARGGDQYAWGVGKKSCRRQGQAVRGLRRRKGHTGDGKHASQEKVECAPLDKRGRGGGLVCKSLTKQRDHGTARGSGGEKTFSQTSVVEFGAIAPRNGRALCVRLLQRRFGGNPKIRKTGIR